MARKFLDFAYNTQDVQAIAVQDGTALTLTNDIRILYDDAEASKDTILLALKLAERAILQKFENTRS